MRAVWKAIACLLLLIPASPALAGITIASYSTVAQINGYAPTSQTQFFEQQTLTNVSPATAQVSGDWMGPNVGGTSPTWHFVGSAQVTSTTTFDADSLTVTAAGSFAYEVTTTPDFVDPSSVSIYAPGAAANYETLFSTDVPTTYTISAQLNQLGRVRLSSFEWGVEFDRSNPTTTPTFVNLTGTIAPGRYHLLITASLGAPNLPNGVNHISRSGSYEDVIFTVQVPEANALGVLIGTSGCMLRRRKRGAGAE